MTHFRYQPCGRPSYFSPLCCGGTWRAFQERRSSQELDAGRANLLETRKQANQRESEPRGAPRRPKRMESSHGLGGGHDGRVGTVTVLTPTPTCATARRQGRSRRPGGSTREKETDAACPLFSRLCVPPAPAVSKGPRRFQGTPAEQRTTPLQRCTPLKGARRFKGAQCHRCNFGGGWAARRRRGDRPLPWPVRTIALFLGRSGTGPAGCSASGASPGTASSS